jgi:cytochrome c oxidase assembly protein subunit 11
VNERQQTIQAANKRLVRRMLLVGVVMFGFSFALVPLYNVFCDAFGLNGRIIAIQKGEYNAAEQAELAKRVQVDKSRLVTVQFLANRNRDLPWEFRPLQAMIKVHPGEVKTVSYFAKNLTKRAIVAQAVPSLQPGLATKYFSKIECFCFNKQKFESGEEREMPLQFVVDPNLPKHINTITIAYTFFDLNREQASIDVESDKRKS